MSAKRMFNVWQADEDEENAVEVYERDHEDAAARWAQEYDADGDYTIVQGAKKTVNVRAVGDTKIICTYEVSGEAEPSYYAHLVKSEDATKEST